MWVDKFDRIYLVDKDFNLLKFEVGEEESTKLSEVSLT